MTKQRLHPGTETASGYPQPSKHWEQWFSGLTDIIRKRRVYSYSILILMNASEGFSSLTLSDGAQIAYEIWGSQHFGQEIPIVLIGGVSSVRGDWDRLAHCLAAIRPVLLFDHRGIGDSRYSPRENDEITVESIARDLLALLISLRWKEVILCGFSMGGTIALQLLFLPYWPSNPIPLPFRVSHVLLTGVLGATLRDKRYGLKIVKPEPLNRRWTIEEKKELVRPTVESTFDPHWLANPANAERLDWWLVRNTSKRPRQVILNQARAMGKFNFAGFYEKLPRNIQFLVIHGKLDAVVPFYCGEFLLENIPWAKLVEVGNLCGQVPTLNFGHHWFEYFDIRIWDDVFRCFLQAPKCCVTSSIKSRL